MARKNPLTPEEKKFIDRNYKSLTVLEMRKRLNRGLPTIYAYIKEKGYIPLNSYKLRVMPAKKSNVFDVHSRENWLV